MTPTPKAINDPDVTAALQRLDQALESPRILAAKAVAEYRGRQLTTPWVNTTDSGAPLLDRDAVIRASEPRHAPNVSQQHPRSLLGRLLFWR